MTQKKFENINFLLLAKSVGQKNPTSVVVELTVTLKETDGNQEVENFRRRTDEVEAKDTTLVFMKFSNFFWVSITFSNWNCILSALSWPLEHFFPTISDQFWKQNALSILLYDTTCTANVFRTITKLTCE